MVFWIRGRMEKRIVRQVKIKPKITAEFKAMARALDIELAELHDRAVGALISKYEDGCKINWLQQLKPPTAALANVRLLPNTFKKIEHISKEESVTEPCVVYTALMEWARKHNFDLT